MFRPSVRPGIRLHIYIYRLYTADHYHNDDMAGLVSARIKRDAIWKGCGSPVRLGFGRLV